MDTQTATKGLGMGLDMYLHRKEYVSGYSHGPDPRFKAVVDAMGSAPCADSPGITVSMTVAYWRKENAIHQWFVDNTAGGVDECQESHVTHEQLTELVGICKEILDEHKGAIDIVAESKAVELLPTASGFFFGTTEYDEWYYRGLEDTVKMLEPLLADTNGDYYYQASW